jgi:hypothetical protein
VAPFSSTPLKKKPPRERRQISNLGITRKSLDVWCMEESEKSLWTDRRKMYIERQKEKDDLTL